MDVFHTYNVIVQGEGIAQPADITIELPEWFGDMAIAAKAEKYPDGAQEGALEALLARITTEYRILVSDPEIVLDKDDISIRKLGDDVDSS